MIFPLSRSQSRVKHDRAHELSIVPGKSDTVRSGRSSALLAARESFHGSYHCFNGSFHHFHGSSRNFQHGSCGSFREGGKNFHGSFHGSCVLLPWKMLPWKLLLLPPWKLPRDVSSTFKKQLPWKLRTASMEAPFIASMEASIAYFHGKSWKLPLKRWKLPWK